MRKLGGIILLAAAVGLSACSMPPAATVEPSASDTPSQSSSADAAAKRIAPLLAAPSPAASVAPEFDDQSAQAKYLAGIKKVWRGDVPSDEILLKAGGAACSLLAEGKHWSDIGGMAGPDGADVDNAAATATYASRNLCTQYNTDR
ncbi:hypothetical protein RI444_16530 [Paenarthrobacter sp. AT5]|uniref:hypothetical protein n=1 Tax=Paenarthrobacter TaxID=1742992 RepID=UPI001A97EAFA|nr:MULTISPECIES: hypothetical protein [Paenarthrobacter]WOC60105.1 hypothetical protein RI444_16530 [Paenarthrobacter sp. AT5]